MKSVIFTFFLFALASNVFATQNKKTLTLRLQSPSGNSDNTTLYFDQDISPAYDVHEDAEMVFDTIPGVPEFYSYTSDHVPCSINGCGTLTHAEVVQIGYHVTDSGLYTISAVLVDNFDATSLIRLVDKKLGKTIDLRENFYQVQLDSSDLTNGRFSIMISTPVQYSSQNANCSNSGGEIIVTPDSSITWNLCQLYDSTHQLMLSDTNVRQAIIFTGLSSGSYHVIFTYSQYSTTYDFYLEGNYVIAGIEVPSQKIYTNEDVIFNGLTTNANQFTWNFGDGTLIDGVDNPDQTYLAPGVYTIQFNCSNGLGCSASATATVTVYLGTGINDPSKKDNITLATQGMTLTVNMNDIALSSNAGITVYNLLGQTIASTPLRAQEASIDLEEQATGYYLVSIKNAGDVNTRRVYLQK